MFQSFHFHFQSATYFLCFIQVDDTPPSISRNGRPIELLPSGPISLIDNTAASLAALMHRGVVFQENHHQASENIPVGSCHCFGTSFQGKSLNSSTYTDSILTFTQFSGHIGWHGNFESPSLVLDN